MGQELRRKVDAPGSASEDGSGADDSDSATDASGDEDGDAQQDLSKPSRAAIAKAKAAAMDIMQSEWPPSAGSAQIAWARVLLSRAVGSRHGGFQMPVKLWQKGVCTACERQLQK